MNVFRIGIVHPTFHVLGGAEHVILKQARLLREKGHHVTLLSARYSKRVKQEFLAMGCECVSLYVPCVPPSDLLVRNLKIMGWRLRPYLDRFDVINVHNVPATIWLGFAARFTKQVLPVTVWTCHEPSRVLYGHEMNPTKNPVGFDEQDLAHPYRFSLEQNQELGKSLLTVSELDQKSIGLMDHIFVNSEYTGQKVSGLFGRSSEVAYFGVDASQFSKPHLKSPGDFVRIGVVARLELLKNVASVLLAFKRFLENQPELAKRCRLNIVGTGSFEQKFKAYANRLGLDEVVDFKGFLSDMDLDAWYSQQDFMVYTPFDEPLGLVPIEAGIRGIPTIGSNSGGPRETIKDSQTGFLVDPLDVDGLAEKMGVLAQDEVLVKQMGACAYDFVKEKFDDHRFCDQFVVCVSKIKEKVSL